MLPPLKGHPGEARYAISLNNTLTCTDNISDSLTAPFCEILFKELA
jgi:hypothetical protein